MYPVFLGFDEIIEIHRDQIERYGGALGIRNLELLRSALAQPSAQFGGKYLHRALFEMAAAYLFHLVQNHPFIDGNKRVGATASTVFLLMNDIEMDVKEKDFENLVMECAQGKANKEVIGDFFRKNRGQIREVF